VTAEYFDQWYADMTGSTVLERAKQRHLGLPPELQSTSGLTLDGLREIGGLLALGPEVTMLDLACGRGGYGLWLARETGARVVGVDFSRVAVEQAAMAMPAFGLDGSRADFRVGALEATGLPTGSVDAVLCVDAIQFAASVEAAATEMRRVLRPGGRVAVTCWEPTSRGDEAVPARLRRLDLATQLTGGGLVDVQVVERPAWRAAERGMWEEAVACDPAGDPALQSWHDEGVRSLATWNRLRRVLATATAP
jgi:SAM-dependent methyltransferase